MKPADVAWPLRERNSLEISTRVEGTKHVQVGLDNDLLREFLDPRLVSLPPGPAHPSERSWGNRRLTAMASVDRAALA